MECNEAGGEGGNIVVNSGAVAVGLVFMIFGFFLLFTIILFFLGIVLGFVGFITFIVGLASSSPQTYVIHQPAPMVYYPPPATAYSPPGLTPQGGPGRTFVKCRQCQSVFEQSIGRCPACGVPA